MEAFTVCYSGCILDSSWSFGSFGVQWGPFGGLWGGASEPFLGLFGDHLGPSWWQSSPLPGDIGPVWTLFGPYLGLCGWGKPPQKPPKGLHWTRKDPKAKELSKIQPA